MKRKSKIIVRYYQPEMLILGTLLGIISAVLAPMENFWLKALGMITFGLAILFIILHFLFDSKHGIITKFQEKRNEDNNNDSEN
ncbi:hypothetical protein PQO01_04810 [Lentisphaera marina]|uniref:hypothetical protein n=1 Tax=Lentisphaera marina TaxID=1111041 RepID=UPI0023672B8C|nr:hypothetical protein [Lentisphaera marina]MDD7984266.1 hypothetical protein [Lentisphaera marina]